MKLYILLFLFISTCFVAKSDSGNKRQLYIISDSLSNEAILAANAGDYDFAIKLGTANVTMLRNKILEDNDFTANALYNLGRFQAMKGDWENAWKNASAAAAMWETLYNGNNINYATALSDAAYYNSRRGNLRFGKEDAELSVKIAERNQCEKMKCYGDFLTNLAHTHLFLREYDKSIAAAQKALTAIENNQGKKTVEYSRALSVLAAATSRNSKNQDEAIKMASEALKLQDQLLPQNSFERALTLNRLFLAYLRKSDSKTAKEYGEEALRIWDSTQAFSIEYEDCIWQMSILHYMDRNYEEALSHCNSLLDYYVRTNSTKSLIYANRLSFAAATLFELGKSAEAIGQQEKSISVIEKVDSKENSSLINAYYNLAHYQINAGNYNNAVEAQKHSVKLSEKLYKGKKQHTEALSRLASIQGAGGDYTSAINTQTLCNKLLLNQKDGDEFGLLEGLNNLASYQNRAGAKDAAYATMLEIIHLYAQKDTINSNYSTALNNTALYASNCGHSTEAKEYQRRNLNVLKQFVAQTQDKYIEALSLMVTYCIADNDNVAAAEYQREKSDAILNKWGKYSNRYASELEIYASFLSNIKRYDEAIQVQKEAIAVLENISEKSAHLNDAETKLSNYYSLNGDYEKARELNQKTIKQTKANTGDQKDAEILAQAAYLQQLAGNNAKALDLSTQSLEIIENTKLRGTKSHAKALSDIAGYYALVHNNKEAINHAHQAVEIYESIADTTNLAIAINNLALFHARIKENTIADSLSNRALQLQAESTGENSVEYANILINVASNKYNADDVEQAIAMNEKAMSIFKNHGKDKTLGYANLLNNHSVYLLNIDSISEAIALRKEALGIRKSVLGEKHPDYLHALVGLCAMLESNDQREDLVKHASECTELITQMLRRQFMSLPAQERASYWNAWNTWYQDLMLKYTEENPNAKMISAAYEGTIFAKGLMLNSECNLKDLIAESSSEVTNSLYADLQNIRKELNKLYDNGAKTNLAQTDSLEHKAAALERRLVSSSHEYGDYTANLSIPSSAVKKNLLHGDAAVEFVSFNDGIKNQYYAFLLTAEDTIPKFIKIASENELLKAKNNRKELSRTVWGPIASNLSPETRQIYFAPAGELYNYPIEYLPDYANESDYISDRWELHRLSSTRQLARSRATKVTNKACVIGGLTYNPDGKNSPFDLPQTKIEAENIYTMLNPHIPEIKLLTGNDGDEKTIRELSGKGYALMHIATHGFCIKEEDEDYQACDIFRSDYIANDHAEDKMLKRSGLMLHGGGPTIVGRGPQDKSIDGVLTAMDIAQLDFRGLDLAVLSACQTALGDITGEGVFGLQRGFKKAGTKSLLMSLWKVDDTATQILMSRFYANLTLGMTKKTSLTEAQKYLRNYTPVQQIYEDDEPYEGLEEEAAVGHPYSSPEYWAAFILLDAIN